MYKALMKASKRRSCLKMAAIYKSNQFEMTVNNFLGYNDSSVNWRVTLQNCTESMVRELIRITYWSPKPVSKSGQKLDYFFGISVAQAIVRSCSLLSSVHKMSIYPHFSSLKNTPHVSCPQTWNIKRIE